MEAGRVDSPRRLVCARNWSVTPANQLNKFNRRGDNYYRYEINQPCFTSGWTLQQTNFLVSTSPSVVRSHSPRHMQISSRVDGERVPAKNSLENSPPEGLGMWSRRQFGDKRALALGVLALCARFASVPSRAKRMCRNYSPYLPWAQEQITTTRGE